MKILVVGSGGREHALAWKLALSPLVKKIYCAPGNPGMAQLGECLNLPALDIGGLAAFARKQAIDLTVVGPDDCLAAGMVDAFAKEGLPVFGPTREAARIESSKAYAKELMAQAGVPTAAHRSFTDYRTACEYAAAQPYPLVVKASGLALGKGVVICNDAGQAGETLRSMMVDSRFGPAGQEVVIEEFLEGPEVSIHAFCDGTAAKLFPPAQDHKPAFDGDQGPNTGGMGSYCPVPWVTSAMMAGIEQGIIAPILRTMSARGTPFVGCLYPGLKFTGSGFKVLEFNARFGDPETQSFMRLLESDLAEIILDCVNGRLSEKEIRWRPGAAACIVAASGGYPESFRKGFAIDGLEQAGNEAGVVVFQAGTAVVGGALATAGGRVLGVSATGGDLRTAVERGYRALGNIHFDGMQYRRDIAAKGLA